VSAVPAVQPLPLSTSATVDTSQPHAGTTAGHGHDLQLRIHHHDRSVHSFPPLHLHSLAVTTVPLSGTGTKLINGTLLHPRVDVTAHERWLAARERQGSDTLVIPEKTPLDFGAKTH